jgi:capsid protein
MSTSAAHPEGVTGSKADAAENRARLAEAKLRESVARERMRQFKALSAGVGGAGKGRSPALNYSGSYPATKRSRLRLGAGGGGSGGGIGARGGSADAHLDSWTLDTLRRDCQALIRSNPAARSIVAKFSELIVGWGPRMTPGGVINGEDSKETAAVRKRKRELWQDWCENERRLQTTRCDHRGLSTFGELLGQWVETAVVDGDLMIIPTDAGTLQTVEGERIASPGGSGTLSRVDPVTGGWINGVRVDRAGVPVAFNVCPYSADGSRVLDDGGEEVAADEAIFLRSINHLRPTQTRGEPALAATPEKFEDLEQTDYAVRKALWVAACQALIVKHPNPAAYQGSLPGETVARNDGSGISDIERDIEAGRMNVLPVGAEMGQFSPEHPSLVYEAYVLMQKGQLAADIGLPILVCLMDPTKTNYSGFRAMLALAYVLVYKWQARLETICRRIYRWKMAGWVRDGLVPMHEGWDACSWVWPPMPVLSPKEELAAQEIAQRMGVKSDEEIIGEVSGREIGDVYAERSAEKARRVALGIEVVKPDPASPAAPPAPAAGAKAPKSDGDESDDSKDQ